MMMKHFTTTQQTASGIFLAVALTLLTACSDSNSGGSGLSGAAGNDDGSEDNIVRIEAGENFQSRLLEALISAQPGDIVEIPEGVFNLTSALSLDVDSVTIRGQGHDKTILDFGGQLSGGESVLVTSNNVTLEDFAVIDAPSDGVKFKLSNGATMRGLRVEWTCGACEENGAYAIYPVQTENVLIEDSIAIGASDAGIYVGQSNKIIVRRNQVSLNVAGIEIENSTNSEVYDNRAENNTGGILVFDLPNLPIEGERTRVFNNEIINNNTPNFAPEGNIVGIVPSGTGVLIMAFSDVEVTGNNIVGNQSTAIVVVDYAISGETTDDANYDGTPRRVYIHDNTYDNNAYDPQDLADTIAQLFAGEEELPQVVYDGLGESEGLFTDADRICVDEDPSIGRGVLFSPIDGLPSVDQSFFDCAHASLPEVVLDTPETIIEGERPLTAEEIAALCSADGDAVNFAALEVDCPKLAGYNLFADSSNPTAQANEGIFYDLTTPLFSDYTEKYRVIFIPEGKQVAYSSTETLDFPIGTIIAKTFAMPRDFLNAAAGEIVIETRLLLHRNDGWKALPYIWNEDMTEASLTLAGGTREISWIHSDGQSRSTEYIVPDANSCKTCHGVTRAETGSGVNTETVNMPIGPKARFLNRDNLYAGETLNQLSYLEQKGLLAGLPALQDIVTAPDWKDTSEPLESRAKAYIDMNCAHCHSPSGFASNSALFMEYWRDVDTAYGVCKTPVAAGAGSGGLSYTIVRGDPDASIMVYRMDSNVPDVRMPERGRTVIHTEGVALVSEWIASLSGPPCQ
jgi:parallel beta-helix repeat protein